MRYLYYTIQTLRRGRTSSFIKLLSLTLGLLVGVLLFAQIAYELNYERCYPESDRLVLVRCAIYDEDSGARKDTDVGEGGYDRTVFDVTAPTLAEEMSQWVESATTVSDFGGQAVYLDDKLLADTRYLLADTAFFQTLASRCWRAIRVICCGRTPSSSRSVLRRRSSATNRPSAAN